NAQCETDHREESDRHRHFPEHVCHRLLNEREVQTRNAWKSRDDVALQVGDRRRVARTRLNDELFRRLLERCGIEHRKEVRREALPFHLSIARYDSWNEHSLN